MTHPIDYGPAAFQARRSFVRDVAGRSALPPHVTAEAASIAVLGALGERLTRGAAHVLLEALPEPLQELFEDCFEPPPGPVKTFGRPELLDAVAQRLGVTPARAELICQAVFGAVRARIPADVSDRVAAQLPRDIRALWYADPSLAEAVAIPPNEPELVHAQILAAIEAGGDLPPEVDAVAALEAVLCIFSRRVSGGEARHLALALPQTLRPILAPCLLHRDEPSLPFDRRELVERVAEHLQVSPEAAERIIRRVFVAMRQSLPEKDVRDAASQLPPELRALWLGT